MQRGAILLLLLLVVPSVPAQNGSLVVTIEDATFDVRPEDWKNRFPPTEESAADADVWSASLGLQFNTTLEVRRGSALTPTTWDYLATLSDGSTQVAGQVEILSAGRVRVLFDVDGSRAHGGQPETVPLAPGPWTLRIQAIDEADGSPRPEGSGSVPIATQDVAFVRMGPAAQPTPGIALPESILPHIREVGPGSNTWMPLGATDEILEVTVATAPGAVLQWDAWVAAPPELLLTPPGLDPIDVQVPIPDLPDPLQGTPLGGNDPTDAAVQWAHGDLGQFVANGDGRLTLGLGNPIGAYVLVVTVHGAAGGMTTFVVPGRSPAHQFTEILVSEPGSEGPVTLQATAPIREAGSPLPAPVYVLSQGVPATTGQARGAALLATGLLAPSGDDAWRGGYDGAATRNAGVPAVAILAFFQDALGRYAGHAAGLRGVQASLEAPLLGVGQPADLVLRLQHAQPAAGAAFSVPMTVQMQFDGTELGAADVELAAGGSLRRTFSITPERNGAHVATATIDTGDLVFEVQRSVDVLDADDYDDATAPWYDIPGPGLAGVALLFVALALRKREI